jgi:RimJ/RimL family protein N-acetyltransferase
MTMSDQKDSLKVRDLSPGDIPQINGYWEGLTPPDCDRMSIDPGRIHTRLLVPGTLQRLYGAPPEARTSDALAWELNGRFVGFSTLRNIRYGQSGEIHLHMTDARNRRSGYGHRFFALSLQEYFRRFELQLIACEPSSRNPGPNRLLAKLGFTVAKTYRTRPSDINVEHEVNRYEITGPMAADALARVL